MATILAIAQDAAVLVGVTRPTTVVGQSGAIERRLEVLANEAGRALVRAHDWTVLQTEKTETLVASQANYALPSDFDRLISNTAWDRTNYWAMRGNLTAAEWQVRKSAIVTTSHVRRAFRIKANSGAKNIFIDPTPESADTIVYEYISSHWCESSGGVGQASWQADSDVLRIDERVFRLELLWRFKRAQGLPYLDEREEAEQAVRDAWADDLALPRMDTELSQILDDSNLPEGNFAL